MPVTYMVSLYAAIQRRGAALTRLHRTKGAFISGLSYSDDANAKVVQSPFDIVDWLNKSGGVISELDESGIGIAASFLAGPRSESSMFRFRQTGDQFTDERWEISRRQLGYVERTPPPGV
jgi:hypothetical protein